ncbi:MAG: 50S ribosomal protein L25/general stress protein Ctc [Hyphomicrobiaceae bacterium]
MADITVIPATARPRAGKGAARQSRREGRVPAVIYGDKKEPETIALDANELWKTVQKGKFTSTVFDVDIDGRKERVLPRDVQLDPLRDTPVHVDFQRVGADSRIRVSVPVRFVNDALSPGLKRGGVLNIVRHDVEVICPAESIPQFFEIDLTGLEIGKSIHISAVALPEGVRPTITNRDFTIATIAGAVKDDAAAEAASATPAAAAAAPAAKSAPAAKTAAAPAKAAAAPAKKK